MSDVSTTRSPWPRAAPDPDRFYFRQLLAGRDFAADDPIARQMVNFVYLIGDRETGEAVVVDPAYGVGELKAIVEADGMRSPARSPPTTTPTTCGGRLMGSTIERHRPSCSSWLQVPIHVQADEAEWVPQATGLGRATSSRTAAATP